jgi:hypothetical protein
LGAEMLLQLPDFPAHQRFGNVESPRGHGKAALFDYANERMEEIPPVHC